MLNRSNLFFNSINENMKQQLSNYLKVNNHNYSTFAKEFGFSPQNIQQWATGSNSPSMKNYLKLIKIIG